MTNTPPDSAAWAARQVGLSPDAPPADVRGALLSEVTRAGFVPSPARHLAWQALCAPPGTRPPCPPEVLLAEESRLRGEVDDFAAAFFATPVAARRQRWQALSALCAFSPPLTARLTALQSALGLDLHLGDIGNPRTAQLASHVAGLFVLAAAARAAQRQAVLRGMQPDVAGWEEIARQLQAVAPALAALEPTLLASVLGWRQQQQRLARAREGREPVTRPAAPRPAGRAAAPAPRAPAATGRDSGRAVGCGALVVAGLFVRICIGLGSHSSSTPNIPPIQPVQVPQFDPKVFDDMERMQRLGREMEEEDRRRKKGEEDMQRDLREIEEINKRQAVDPPGADSWREEEPAPPSKRDDKPARPGPDSRRNR